MRSADLLSRAMLYHSTKVRFAKFLLVGLIVLMMAALVLTAVFHKENERFNLTYQSLNEGDTETPAMLNPKLQGVDARGRPYRVVAEKAEQLAAQTVKLYQLQSFLHQKEETMELSAKTGVVQIDKQQLTLDSDIHFKHGDNFQLATDSAEVNFKDGSVQGDSPIYGAAPMGTLQAERFRATEGGEVVWFGGKVKLIITRLPQDKDNAS